MDFEETATHGNKVFYNGFQKGRNNSYLSGGSSYRVCDILRLNPCFCAVINQMLDINQSQY